MRDDVIKIIADYIEVDAATVQPHDTLINDCGMELEDMLEIAFLLEQQYNFDIPDEIIKDWEIVEDIINAVQQGVKSNAK